MSKMDYDRLAMVIRKAFNKMYAASPEPHVRFNQAEGIRLVVNELCDNLTADNPRFDAGKFRSACFRRE